MKNVGGKTRPRGKSRPQLRHVVPRARLFEALDASSEAAIWVCGAPGAGKTFAVASWLEASDAACLWYLVTRSDADLGTFALQLGQAAATVSRRKRRLPLLAPEYLAAPEGFVQRYFREFWASLPAGCTVVFDDVHEALVENSGFDMILLHAVDNRPDEIRLIIIGRHAPPPILSRARANQTLRIIDDGQLRLTAEETAQIVAHWQQPEAAASHLHQDTHGWMTGVVVGLEQLRRDGQRADAPSTATELSAYFATLPALRDDTVSQFLEQTAVLPQFDVAAAQAVSERSDCARILSKLAEQNTFIERRGAIYRYHPLFREYLLRRLREQSPDDLEPLYRRAARILIAADDLEESMALLSLAGDSEGLAGMLLTHARRLSDEGRYALLLRGLSLLPPAMTAGHPWLTFWLGTCSALLRPGTALPHLEAAYALFEAQNEPVGMLLAWTSMVEAIIIEGDGYHRLDACLDRLPGLTARLDALPPEMSATVTSSIYQALCMRRPSHPQFDLWQARALSIFERTDDPTIKARIGASHLLHALLYGDLSQAAMVVETWTTWCQSHRASPFATITFKWCEASYRAICGEHAACTKAVREGLALAEHSGMHALDGLLLGLVALSHLNAGEIAEADAAIERMARDPRPWNRGSMYFARAWRALTCGRPQEALALSEQSLRLSYSVGDPLATLVTLQQLAIIRVTSGDLAAMRESLQAFEALGARMNSKWTIFASRLLRAHDAFESGDQAAGLEHLRISFGNARETGSFGLLLWLPHILSPLCARALQAGIETEFVTEFVRRRSLSPPPGLIDRDAWPWAVEVVTLGRFEVHSRGQLLQPARKAQRKPLDLLRAVLAAGGRDVPLERLVHDLWPDADGDAAHKMFTVTLHRLRQLLEVEGALVLREGRVSIDSTLVWIDFWAFDRLLEPRTDSSYGFQDAHRLERAMALYRGPFLGDEEVDRAQQARLRVAFERCVTSLVALLAEAAQVLRAREVLLRALEIERLEAFERLLERHPAGALLAASPASARRTN